MNIKIKIVRWQHKDTGRTVDLLAGWNPGMDWLACGGTVSADAANNWIDQANKQISIVKYNQYKGVPIPESNSPDFEISMGRYNLEIRILYKPLKKLLFSIFMFFWKRVCVNKGMVHGSFSFTGEEK
jgi:hypothetical protein